MDNKSAVWTTNEENNQSSRTPTVNGHDKCSFNNPFLVAVQSKFRRKYYHKIVFLILIIIILALLIALILVSVKIRNSLNVCETKECLRSASNLLLTMDQTVDPCEDFYQFTCGNWPEEHPRPDSVTSYDWFSDKQTKVVRMIRTFLQANTTTNEPEAVKKTKIMYKSCIDIDEMDKLGVKAIYKYLNEYKLPLIPSILNITNDNETYEFDWIETLVNIKKSLGMDILIGFDVFPDPTNHTKNRIAIGTPEIDSVLPFNDNDHLKMLKKAKKRFVSEGGDDEEETEQSPTLTAYLNYMRKVVTFIVVNVMPNVEIDDILDNINTAASEAVRITKYIYKLNENAENMTKGTENPLEDLENLVIKELQNLTDELIIPKTLPIWNKYLALMLNSTQVIKFNIKSERILTSKADIKYLQDLTQFLTETSRPKIEFFIWWTVIEEIILHTTSDLRELHNEYTRLVTGIEGSTPRSLYCASGINSMMGMAVSYNLANENFINETRRKVEQMLNNIREAFKKLVEMVNWMDQVTKVSTLNKSDNMKSLIGFPEWILNKTALDLFYTGVNVNISTHLDNMMGILKWRMKNKLFSLNEMNEFGWATAPSSVNAFHTFQANTITIPIGILQYPFYDLGLEALNYGAIGTILGHELTHGFDDSGRMFDKNGNMRQWWTNNTIAEYVNRTACFVKQYGGFYLTDIDEYVNGELTLGENIADNGGLREAYHAYKILINSIGSEKFLPGLEQYTHEQLLFISFGNLWCESVTPAATRYATHDSHCPGRVRLKGVLTNSPEFSKAFNCRKGSSMYPTEERCRIW